MESQAEPRPDHDMTRMNILTAALLLLAAGPGCGPRSGPPTAPGGVVPAMGTFASVTLAGADAARLAEAETLTAGALQRVEEACSLFKPESDLARLNAAAGAETVALSSETETVLRAAQRHGEWSAGAFDITVGPLMRLWGFRGGGPPAEPDPTRLAAVLADVGWRHVALSNGTARLLRPGTRADLGGIAKGYGVDRACEALLSAGFSNALVNLGGNIRVLGAPDPGRPWRVAVRHPFNPDKTVGALALEPGQAVATSGHYEQFVVIQGRRAAHIMDPRTGRPVEGMASVTVLARTAMDADALSTAAFVLGLEAIPGLLERAGGLGALAVPDRQPLELWITPGLASRFTPNPDLKVCMKTLAP
jgi:thiamine biosynthesis lipoprotein